MTTPIALTIAGSDPSGGAGIQADLKTFSALGVYGASVIAALTAQNTNGVSGVMAVPPEFVAAQMEAVFTDLDVGAVKIGMLGGGDLIVEVAKGLAAHAVAKDIPIVLDPVMVAKSGDRLLAEDAVEALARELVPLATVITPNLPEAAVLLDEREARDLETMEAAAWGLLGLGPRSVLLKGGHLGGDQSPDVFLDGEGCRWIQGARIDTKNTHGTGCTLSSAIAAHLARGEGLWPAVQASVAYVRAAIAAADGLAVGGGRGPVHHFHDLWTRLES